MTLHIREQKRVVWCIVHGQFFQSSCLPLLQTAHESGPSPSQLTTNEAQVKVIACLLCMFVHSRSGIVYTSTCSIRYSIYLNMQYQV